MGKLKKLLSAIVITLPLTVQAQTVELTTMNWPPFYAENLERGGFISALVDEAFKASGYDSEIAFTGWENALNMAQQGKKDGIVGGYYSEERANHYYFSMPIYNVMAGLIKKDNFPLTHYTSFDEVNSYSIGKLQGSIIGESFDSYPFSHLKQYPEVSDAVKALNDGEIQLYADNLAVAKEAAKAAGIDGSKMSMLLPPLEENELYLLIPKAIPNSKELLDAFNKGMLAIRESGRYNEVLAEFNQK